MAMWNTVVIRYRLSMFSSALATLAGRLPPLLEIPEHHYFVAVDRSWFGCFSFEGDVDLAFITGGG